MLSPGGSVRIELDGRTSSWCHGIAPAPHLVSEVWDSYMVGKGDTGRGEVFQYLGSSHPSKPALPSPSHSCSAPRLLRGVAYHFLCSSNSRGHLSDSLRPPTLGWEVRGMYNPEITSHWGKPGDVPCQSREDLEVGMG